MRGKLSATMTLREFENDVPKDYTSWVKVRAKRKRHRRTATSRASYYSAISSGTLAGSDTGRTP
jgi:hypothetical protein